LILIFFANKKHISQIGISNLNVGIETLKSQRNNAEEKKAKEIELKRLNCIINCQFNAID
jgi:hypothetical protein